MKKLLVFSSVVLFISLGIIFFYGCGKTPEKSLLGVSTTSGSGGSGITIAGASFAVNSQGFELVNGEPPTPTSDANAPSIKKITGDKNIGPGAKQTITIEWIDPGGARPTIGCFPRRRNDPKSPGSWWRHVGRKDGATSGKATVEYTFSEQPSDTNIDIVILAITPGGGTPIGGIGIHQGIISVFNGVWKGPYTLTITDGECTWNHKGDFQVNLSQDDNSVTGASYLTGVQILQKPGCALQSTVTVSNLTVTGTASGSTMTGTLSGGNLSSSINGSNSPGAISFTAKLSEDKKTLNGTLTYTGSGVSGSGSFTLTR